MRPRAPWWMWFLASTFVLYGAFVIYCNRFGPEPIGAKFDFQRERMLLLAVTPNSPADRAGLRPGDAEWARAANDGRMVPIATHLPQAPVAWQKFFERALNPQPQQRPPSAMAWYADFEAAVVRRGAAAGAP